MFRRGERSRRQIAESPGRVPQQGAFVEIEPDGVTVICRGASQCPFGITQCLVAAAHVPGTCVRHGFHGCQHRCCPRSRIGAGTGAGGAGEIHAERDLTDMQGLVAQGAHDASAEQASPSGVRYSQSM